jgi:hypothetical protein
MSSLSPEELHVIYLIGLKNNAFNGNSNAQRMLKNLAENGCHHAREQYDDFLLRSGLRRDRSILTFSSLLFTFCSITSATMLTKSHNRTAWICFVFATISVSTMLNRLINNPYLREDIRQDIFI